MKTEKFNKIKDYFLSAIISIFAVAVITVLTTEVTFMLPVVMVYVLIINRDIVLEQLGYFKQKDEDE